MAFLKRVQIKAKNKSIISIIRLFRQADAPQQILKLQVFAQRVEKRLNFQPDEKNERS